MCGGLLAPSAEETRKHRPIKSTPNVPISPITKGRNITVELLRKRETVSLCLGTVSKIYLYHISGALVDTDQYPPITTLGHSRGTGKHAHPDSKSSLILDYYWNVAQSFKERQS